MSNDKKLSMAALICGILGLVGGWIPVVRNVTLILAIVAIVLGIKGRKNGGEKKLATIGMVLGIVGVVESIIIIIYTFVLIGAAM